MKMTIKVIACFIILFSIMPLAFASQVVVEKKLNQTDFKTGEEIYIFLEINNPFDEILQVQFEDKNILSDNGVHIECAEYSIPKKTKISLVYSPTMLYEAGEFKLEKAKVTYTNPLTQKQEESFSNEVELSVKGDAVAGNMHQLKKIYKCNGISRESTSISSSSPPQQSSQQNTQEEQASQESKEQEEKLNKLSQNNAQTLSSMKQQMQAEQEELKKQIDEFKRKIEESDSFKQQANELNQKGFEKNQSNIFPKDENNANFGYEFSDKNNNKEYLYGEIQNNSVSVNKFGSEEMKNAIENIEKNRKFSSIESDLKEQGFELEKKEFSPDFDNKDLNFNYTYKNKLNQTKNIIGNATLEGKIKSVNLSDEKEEDKKPDYFWIFFVLIFIVLLAIYYKRKKTANILSVVQKPKEKKYNWRADAERHFDESKKLFENGKQKQACQELSFGVKLMFKHRNKDFENIDELKKMTTSDILNSIKNKKFKTKIKKCLTIIDSVIFAKHKIAKSEFEYSLKLAKDVFKSEKEKN
ncbi:MAG: hypothetical protein KAQ92_01380 [Candidatus Aenigmarchaeota archaeon]|nr:hypothetical protein [Candidatus Aenigmarchaeota archaeon]